MNPLIKKFRAAARVMMVAAILYPMIAAAADLPSKKSAPVFTPPTEITRVAPVTNSGSYFLAALGVNLGERAGFALSFRDQTTTNNTVNKFGIQMTPGCGPCDGHDLSGVGAHISGMSNTRTGSPKLLGQLGFGVIEAATDTGLREVLATNFAMPTTSFGSLAVRGLASAGENIGATALFGGNKFVTNNYQTNYFAGNNGYWNNYSTFPNADGMHYTKGDFLYSKQSATKTHSGPSRLEYGLAIGTGLAKPFVTEVAHGLVVGQIAIDDKPLLGASYTVNFDEPSRNDGNFLKGLFSGLNS
jgi:hypothetical protein